MSSLLAVAACGVGKTSGEGELVVFAAASSSDVVSELAAAFGGARVRASYGPSSGLARQIAGGAPADVFVSASRRWMEFLVERGLVAGAPRVLAHNRLVCIAPRGSPLATHPPGGARELAARLAPDQRVAIADDGVPAGEYARQSLRVSGDLAELAPRLVGLADVRAVLRAVDSGQAAAGFVYATDARLEPVATLFELDPATHEPIELLIAPLERARDATLASAFVQHALDARSLLASAGFDLEAR